MEAWTLCRQALSATARSWRIVIILWITNVLLALMASVPIWVTINKALGSSPMIEDVQSLLASPVLSEASRALEPGQQFLGISLLTSILLGLLTNILFVGGILGRLDAREKGGDGLSVFAGFLADSGRFAWRSFRLTAYGAVLTLTVLLLLVLLNRLVELYAQSTLYESPVLWIELLVMLIVLPLFLGVRAIVDAARADMFLEERTNMRLALRRGFFLITRNPRSAFAGYLMTGGLCLVALLLFLGLRRWVPEHTTAGYLLAMLFGQAMMFARQSSVVGTYAASLFAWQQAEMGRPVASTGVPFGEMESFSSEAPSWEPVEEAE